MQHFAPRALAAAGAALLGAGLVVAPPTTGLLPAAHAIEIQLFSGAMDITLDLVRHGQSVDNLEGILGTVPPGAPLTDLGREQAITVGNALYNDGDNNIGAVYASELLRTQQTAWPLVQLLQGTGDSTDIPDGPPPLFDPSHILAGLNEINAGFLEGQPLNTFTEIAYAVPMLMWIMGNYSFPMLGSDIDPNGMAFQDRVSDAIQTIYDNNIDGTDPGGTDVVFAHAGTITGWALMNVKNPDFDLVLKMLLDTHNPLSNTGQVVLEGNPTDGWTLVSWDGHDVGPADLGTALFVDYRDLITAPQMALWHIWEAIQGGDPDTITTALQTGLDDVVAAMVQFPQAVFDDIMAAL